MNRRNFLSLASGVAVGSRLSLPQGKALPAEDHSSNTGASTHILLGEPGFDELKMGFKKGEMTLIAGNYFPNRAKQFSLRLIDHAIRIQKKTVLVVGSWFPHEYRRDILEAHGPNKELNSQFIYQYSCWEAPSFVRKEIEKTLKSRSIDFVVIDNIDTIGGVLDERKQPRTKLASLFALNAIAKELAIPLVVNCSFEKFAHARKDKRPVLTDLYRDSDLVCDSVVLLKTERDYNRESNSTILEANIAKNMNGATGIVSIDWLMQKN